MVYKLSQLSRQTEYGLSLRIPAVEHNESSSKGKRIMFSALQVSRDWVSKLCLCLTLKKVLIVKSQKILLNVRVFFSLKLSAKNVVKISDVGISKEAVDITGTIAGSPAYIAPEVFKSELYNSKADIYSLGIILWEVWYGEQAFSKILNLQQQQFFGCVARGERPKPLEGYSKPLWKELMEECWAANPQERPTAEQCLERISRLGG